MRAAIHGAHRRGLLSWCHQHDAFRDADTAGPAALAQPGSRAGVAMTQLRRAWHRARRGARQWLGATRRGSALLPLWALAWALSGRFDERLRQRRMARLLAASGRFDSAYYRAAYPDAGDPLWDYVTRSRNGARNPNATFDSAYYLAMNPEVAAQGLDPFIHYLRHGEAEGRRAASPLGEAPSAAEVDEAQASSPDTAVVVHLAHPELWPELLSFIRSVPSPFDLHVSVAGEAAFRAIAATILASVPDAVIHVVPCRGRDMAPFLALLGGPLAAYRVVCKIHAQTRPVQEGLQEGLQERRQERRLEQLRALLGSRGHVARIKALFDANPKLGLIGPAGFRVRQDPAQGENAQSMALLCRALDIAPRDLAADWFAGAMVWVRPAALAPLARLRLAIDAFEPETGQDSGTLAHAIERALNTVVRLAGYRVVDTAAVDLSASASPFAEAPALVAASRVKLIAFYHPEFHWERDPARRSMRRVDPWLEVARARPLFAGHAQPRLPAELGFADLGLAEVRAAQAALAARHGVHGFCYRYEWFNGVARHARPLAETIASGAPDFPFCLLWPCTPSPGPARGRSELAPDFAAAFIADILPALRDRRCVRWNGRPVLLIEGVAALPAPEATVATWRDHARAAGLGEIHLCAVCGDADDPARTAGIAAAADFDAVVAMPRLEADASSDAGAKAGARSGGGLHDMTADLPGRAPAFAGPVYDYAAIAARDLVRGAASGGLRQHRGVLAGHDDSPRTGKGPVVHGASPAEYGRWLEGVIEQERAAEPAGDVLVFVASWNDWAGGAVLEPDLVHGRGFLAATAAALGKAPRRDAARMRARHSDVSPGAPLR
jgi:lipopolysaccharide biosynthesis protein